MLTDEQVKWVLDMIEYHIAVEKANVERLRPKTESEIYNRALGGGARDQDEGAQAAGRIQAYQTVREDIHRALRA